MSQHDLSIANQGFPAFRSDLNDALQALGSMQSGATAPSTTYANMLWYDTANNIVKQRNEDNDAWISLFTLDQSADTLTAIAGKTLPSGTIVGTSDSQAFTNKTFSDDTTVYGVKVGRGAGAVSGNTAVGANALASNTTGSDSTFIGYEAGKNFNTGVRNTSVGYQSGYSVTGSYNSSLGSSNMGSEGAGMSGSNNVAVGSFSLANTTSGSNNTALGAYALQNNSTGGRATAIGYQALYNNTASYNVAIGYQSGYNTTSGTNNTYLGYAAGYTNQTGAGNTLVGVSAGYFATGSYNTFIGFSGTSGDGAGVAVTTGSNNIIVGGFSGNQNGLDMRTGNNYTIISDGQGNRTITSAAGCTVALQGASISSGTGISFPATQSASSDANTLDDYEEGTFTATFTASGGSNPTLSYSYQSGRYVKVGKLVYFTVRMGVSSFSGGSSYGLLLSGLPFTAVSSPNSYPAGVVNYKVGFTTNGPDYGRILSNTTDMEFYYDSNTTETAILTNNLSSSLSLIVTGCYESAS